MLHNPAKRNSRIAVIAILLFLVCDFTVLALNFWLSKEIEQQAIAINLAGRQRMLSQRMVKCLLQIRMSHLYQIEASDSLAELGLTFQLFDNTLLGFSKGHATQDGQGAPLFLTPVKTNKARRIVKSAEALWQPYRQWVQAVINATPDTLNIALLRANKAAKEANLKLLGLMNDLTNELERNTQQEASNIRLYQIVAFVFALFNFITAFLVYSSKVRSAQETHNRLFNIINNISCSILVMDEHETIVHANHTAERFFEYSAHELTGLNLSDLISQEGNDSIGHRKNKDKFPVAITINESHWDGARFLIGTVIDVTLQRHKENHLSHLAFHDLLTHLPNRLLFDDRLRHEIAHMQRHGLMLAVLFVDLDKFKPINDEYGHEVGDLLLQDVALRLKACLRESDTVARRGGDEFTIILCELSDRRAIAQLAELVLRELMRPFCIREWELRIGASIGISVFPSDGSDPDALVKHADMAMYEAKKSGRGAYCFYVGQVSKK
jgi:diguanylate cyclase (GGDEF)-like protein